LYTGVKVRLSQGYKSNKNRITLVYGCEFTFVNKMNFRVLPINRWLFAGNY